MLCQGFVNARPCDLLPLGLFIEERLGHELLQHTTEHNQRIKRLAGIGTPEVGARLLELVSYRRIVGYSRPLEAVIKLRVAVLPGEHVCDLRSHGGRDEGSLAHRSHMLAGEDRHALPETSACGA
jgi:hypothetical protein